MEDRRSGAVGRLRIGDFVRGLEDVGVYLVLWLWLLIAPSFLPSFGCSPDVVITLMYMCVRVYKRPTTECP